MDRTGALSRAKLAEALRQRTGLPKAFAVPLVDSIISQICAALQSGENVKIKGFGSFVLLDKPERIGRNPKTKIEVPISPRRVVTFWPSSMLRNRVKRPV